MSKILFIGDPHLKINQLELGKQFLQWVEDVIRGGNYEYVINLGDTLDQHAVIRAEVLTEYVNHLKRLYRENCGIQYYHLLGNHELFRAKDSTYTALHPIRDILPGNFYVIDKVTEIEVDDQHITMVPYLIDHTQFPKETRSLCVAHQTFVGADYGFHRPDVGVDADTISADLIISGHIHKRQQFGKVIYPGSPFSCNANDVNQVKGLMTLDLYDYKTEFIECPLPRWRSLEFTVDGDFTVQNLHSALKAALNDKDNFIVSLTGYKTDLQSYLKSRSYNDLIINKKITMRPTFLDKDKVKQQIRAASFDQVISDYIDNVYGGAIDKNTLKSAAYDIIKTTE